MKLHSLLLLLVLAAIAAFAALNWEVFLSPTELSLGYTTVNTPLGLMMLGILAIVTTLFLAFVVYLQGSVLFETRRHSRELQACQTACNTFQNSDSKDALLARIDKLEHEFQSFMEQSGNTLAAYIGELEDRLEKISIPLTVR